MKQLYLWSSSVICAIIITHWLNGEKGVSSGCFSAQCSCFGGFMQNPNIYFKVGLTMEVSSASTMTSINPLLAKVLSARIWYSPGTRSLQNSPSDVVVTFQSIPDTNTLAPSTGSPAEAIKCYLPPSDNICPHQHCLSRSPSPLRVFSPCRTTEPPCWLPNDDEEPLLVDAYSRTAPGLFPCSLSGDIWNPKHKKGW